MVETLAVETLAEEVETVVWWVANKANIAQVGALVLNLEIVTLPLTVRIQKTTCITLIASETLSVMQANVPKCVNSNLPAAARHRRQQLFA